MKYLFFILITCTILFSCKKENRHTAIETPLNSVTELAQHSSEFDKPEIIEVTDGIHVAVGFGLANSILIEGES